MIISVILQKKFMYIFQKTSSSHMTHLVGPHIPILFILSPINTLPFISSHAKEPTFGRQSLPQNLLVIFHPPHPIQILMVKESYKVENYALDMLSKFSQGMVKEACEGENFCGIARGCQTQLQISKNHKKARKLITILEYIVGEVCEITKMIIYLGKYT